jgi:hypothetical protein
MNFIGRIEGPGIQVELKYCERCGGLWLRPQGADGVYCASCRVRLAALPNSGEAPLRQGRRRKERVGETDGRREHIHSSVRIEYLQGVAAMEVRA